MIRTKTIGPVSAEFITKFMQVGKFIFTLDDAINIYGKDSHSTSSFLSDLVRRNIIARIKSGVFIILQTGQESTQLSNWPLIAHELAGKRKYYISHYSAMRIHGMTTHLSFDVYITMSKRSRTKKINNINYHFIFVKPEYFWGANNHWVTKQNRIFVSDIEKTILDSLERPDLCGGMKEVIRGIWAKHKEINWEKLFDYSKKFRTKAAVKRLGFILEALDLDNDYIIKLAKIAAAKDFILLDPNGSDEGKFLSRWHVRININLQEIITSVWE